MTRWVACAAAAFMAAGLFPAEADAQLKVVACVPEWAALAQAIGGDKVTVTLATSAQENPDGFKATPVLISALQEADLLACTGLGLSAGIDDMLEKAQNPKLMPGQPGYFLAGDYVEVLQDTNPHQHHATEPHEGEGADEHAEHDAEGHIHEYGNPHIQGDPRNVQKVAAQLAKRMAAIDPANEAAYEDAAKAFIRDLGQLAKKLQKDAEPLKGINIVSQHEHSVYVLRWLGINNVATVEPEPGVPPGPDHLASVMKAVVANNVKFVIYAAYEDPSPSQFIAEKTGVPLVKLPFTVGGSADATDFLSFFQDTVQRLLDGLNGRERS